MPELDLNKNNKIESSAIKQSGFSSFLSTLFGWRRNNKNKGNIEFSQVDLSAKDQRIGQAFINNAPNLHGPMSQELEELFNIWLNDNTDKYQELQERAYRINQLEFMVLNDPHVGRAVDLYADESTQLDQQDTIINIETPDARMTKDMYKLLNQWGLTQNRVRETIRQLAIYGDAFWANTVTERGIERIVPLQQLQVTDIVEFSPIKALEMKKRREGFFGSFASNNYLISQMLQSLETKDSFADLFDNKLFGYYIDQDITVPAWSVTHFRVGDDGSQFYPWGTSPILGALAPYKQTQSAIALQSLAREMNFPITIFEVKTDENMDEGSQFAAVNRVREEYDNIGVSQRVGNSEVYTVNTKIWTPENLLKVSVQKADNSNVDSVEDIKLYQNRTAVALGIPSSFFGAEGKWFDVSHSGKSLTQQYKPFARKCFTIQSAFLEGLADEFRLHFAITGQYDFRIPFTLSMKYPAVEKDGEYTSAQKDSIEIANSVANVVKTAIGAGEDEPLPADIIRDIIAKYTFLDPADIMKWTRDAKYYIKPNNEEGEGGTSDFGDIGSISSSEGGISGGEDFDIGELDEEPSEIETPPEDKTPEADVGEITLESRHKVLSIEDRLREYELRPMNSSRRLREKELIQSYRNCSNNIYFESLELCAVNNFTRRNEHIEVFNTENSHLTPMLETLNSQHKSERLAESFKMKKKRKSK